MLRAQLLGISSLSILAVSTLTGGATAQVTPTADGCTVVTTGIELTIARGAITRVVNRLTGEQHTSANAATPWMPTGLVASSDMQPVPVLHNHWSSHEIYTGGLAPSIATLDRAPGDGSRMISSTINGGVRCVWTGLTDGVRVYPRDTLTIDVTFDVQTGIVDIAAEATTPEGSVVGVVVPIRNLHPRHTVVVPSFGGMAYPPAELNKRRLYTLGGAPFTEAPIIVADGDQGSIAMWVEDRTFRPTFTFFGGDAAAGAIGLEALNDMPFEGHTSARRATWRIGASKGSWMNAVAPYRNWYLDTFAGEIAMRKTSAWPNDIAVIVDRVSEEPGTLERLAKLLDSRTVLLHDWSARQADFDTALPDATPRPSFVRRITEAKRLGFRSMGYVNSYCINYRSPVFLRDQIGQFALPRRIEGIGSYATPRRTFESSIPNQVLYLDPLAPEWRRYHVDSMIRWRQVTGADANYEDTGGTGGDFGNGEVAGLRGAQGSWAQFREMLQRNPVPMATEYAPDNIAFASSWGLRYLQVWGTPETRRDWPTRLRPMNVALFGGAGRAWVPTIVADDERSKAMIASFADALGGVTQLEATRVSFDAKAGLARHLVERAQLFASLSLVPVFDGWPKDPGIVARYRDKDGKIHTYRARPGLQELSDPNGVPHYQRITGTASHDAPLVVAGWPARDGTKTIALNPDAPYALTRATSVPTLVGIDRVPEGLHVTRYSESGDHVLVAFGGKGRAGEVLRLTARTDFTDVVVGDRKGRTVRRSAPLRTGDRADFRVADAAYVILQRKAPAAARLTAPLAASATVGRFISDATGIERGGSYTSPNQKSLRLSGSSTSQTFRFVSHGGDSEIAYDYFFTAPSPDSAVEVAFRNTQIQHGNGSTARVYVNGALAKSEHLGPVKQPDGRVTADTNARVFRVPVGAGAGRPIVVTVAVWGNGDDNADEIWVTEPKLVRDAATAPSVRTVAVVGD